MLLVSTAAYGFPSRIERMGGRGDTIFYFMALLWRKLCHGVVLVVVTELFGGGQKTFGGFCVLILVPGEFQI
jgi:hypothetical protein